MVKVEPCLIRVEKTIFFTYHECNEISKKNQIPHNKRFAELKIKLWPIFKMVWCLATTVYCASAGCIGQLSPRAIEICKLLIHRTVANGAMDFGKKNSSSTQNGFSCFQLICATKTT